MTDGKCAIWGTEATTTKSALFLTDFNSPRTGGFYSIADGVAEIIGSSQFQSDDTFKAKLTTWLVDQRRNGNKCPKITDEVFQETLSRKTLLTSERVERFFLYWSSQKLRPGSRPYGSIRSSLNISANNALRILDIENAILAWTESESVNDFHGLEFVMKEIGYISGTDTNNYTISALGFQRMEELERSNRDSKQAFVAMWFDPDDNSIFDEGIRPAIEIDPYGKETGFKALRVDREQYSDFIIDFMIGNIKRSKFVVADFTSFMVKGHKVLNGKALSSESEDFQIARGGVYYEVGYAMGLGIPVIATCQKDQTSHIHFDLKQFNTIYWTDVVDLRKQLSERIFGMFVS